MLWRTGSEKSRVWAEPRVLCFQASLSIKSMKDRKANNVQVIKNIFTQTKIDLLFEYDNAIRKILCKLIIWLLDTIISADAK